MYKINILSGQKYIIIVKINKLLYSIYIYIEFFLNFNLKIYF